MRNLLMILLSTMLILTVLPCLAQEQNFCMQVRWVCVGPMKYIETKGNSEDLESCYDCCIDYKIKGYSGNDCRCQRSCRRHLMVQRDWHDAQMSTLVPIPSDLRPVLPEGETE